MAHSYKKLLVTGAAGGIGTLLRNRFRSMANEVRLSDKHAFAEASDNEQIVLGDLSDPNFALEVTKDIDAVFHFGGKSIEGTFETILQSNIIGLYNLYEGCRKNGVKRVVFASSNHVVGFHNRTDVIDSNCLVKPDSNYGVSKAFGEGLASLYWDKYGIESVSIRIGSCLVEPRDMRMMSTWISPDDMAHLLERCLKALVVKHTIVYGVSNNAEKIWDNRLAGHLGFEPKNSSEKFRASLESVEPNRETSDPVYQFHGGAFAGSGHFED